MTSTSVPPVLEPATNAAVRDVVAAAHDAGEPLRIIGAGTWHEAGAPVDDARTLSLRALSGIMEYVPGDLTLTAWAGTTLAELSQATAAHGQWLGLDPAGDRTGTVGATIATASSGPLAHAFGTPRDLVLGLHAVTGYGEAVRPGGRVVKNVAGFDLVRLYTGAWGTLGPITAVTVRLRALPVHDVTLAMPVDDEAHLARLLDALRGPALSLLALEWLDRGTARALGVGTGADALLLRLGGNDAFVRGQRARIDAIAPCTTVDASVWGALAARDRAAPLVLRVSGAVATLPARIARLRTTLDASGAAWAMHARAARGGVRVIVDDAPAALHGALGAVAGEQRITERQPAAWWAGAPDAFEGGLAGRVRQAFDPARICNRRAVPHA